MLCDREFVLFCAPSFENSCAFLALFLIWSLCLFLGSYLGSFSCAQMLQPRKWLQVLSGGRSSVQAFSCMIILNHHASATATLHRSIVRFAIALASTARDKVEHLFIKASGRKTRLGSGHSHCWQVPRAYQGPGGITYEISD